MTIEQQQDAEIRRLFAADARVTFVSVTRHVYKGRGRDESPNDYDTRHGWWARVDAGDANGFATKDEEDFLPGESLATVGDLALAKLRREIGPSTAAVAVDLFVDEPEVTK